MQTGRVYDDPHDGSTRVLVDRLWPRGVKREDPRIDEWLPHVAPSNELRRWYGHDPERETEFRRRYRHELVDADHAEALDALEKLVHAGPVTLVTATREVEHSHLPVLVRALDRR